MNVFQKLEQIGSHPRLPHIWIGIFTVILLVRVDLFAASFGSIEHDDGWELGVAKNLALHGIYASYTNTIVDEGVGPHPSIHRRMSVQDAEGFSYFPAGASVGPGYMLPEALAIKLFGSGWWQYRTWPLLAFLGLIIEISFLVWLVGGMLALFALQAWLWIAPQLYLPTAFQSFSEHVTLFFLLAGFLTLEFYRRTRRKKLLLILAGTLYAFAILTKSVSALSGLAFVVWIAVDSLRATRKLGALVRELSYFFLGMLTPILSFEAYRFLSLTNQFGRAGWDAINVDIRGVYRTGGAGIDVTNFDPAFIARKFAVWRQVGMQPAVAWILFLVAPLTVAKFTAPGKRRGFAMMYVASATIFTWYLFISPTGWARHSWLALMMGIACISIGCGVVLRRLPILPRVIVLLATLSLGEAIFFADRMEASFSLGESLVSRWQDQRKVDPLQGLPPIPIFSLKDQIDFVAFATTSIQKTDRIYYVGGLLVAEMSPLIDQVFYPLDRYINLKQKNPSGGKSFVIFGPYQQGPLSLVEPNHVPRALAELCLRTLYQNPSYALCELRSDLRLGTH